MGSQFRVYLCSQDEADLMQVLNDRFGILLCRPVYYEENEKVVHLLSDLGRYPTDQQLALTLPDFMDNLGPVDIRSEKLPKGRRLANCAFSHPALRDR